MYACVEARDLGYLHPLFSTLVFERGSLSELIQQDWSDRKALGTYRPHILALAHATLPGFLKWVLGFKIRFSCFTN